MQSTLQNFLFKLSLVWVRAVIFVILSDNSYLGLVSLKETLPVASKDLGETVKGLLMMGVGGAAWEA